MRGSGKPAGWGVAMRKLGPTSFAATVKKDGKPMYRYEYTPSTDGRMLAVSGGAAATREAVKMVYDRQ